MVTIVSVSCTSPSMLICRWWNLISLSASSAAEPATLPTTWMSGMCCSISGVMSPCFCRSTVPTSKGISDFQKPKMRMPTSVCPRATSKCSARTRRAKNSCVEPAFLTFLKVDTLRASIPTCAAAASSVGLFDRGTCLASAVAFTPGSCFGLLKPLRSTLLIAALKRPRLPSQKWPQARPRRPRQERFGKTLRCFAQRTPRKKHKRLIVLLSLTKSIEEHLSNVHHLAAPGPIRSVPPGGRACGWPVSAIGRAPVAAPSRRSHPRRHAQRAPARLSHRRGRAPLPRPLSKPAALKVGGEL